MMPIDEAARAMEQLLGPYTGEEHAKRGLVVRESRLNRAYLVVLLAEHLDPDEGRKKQGQVPEELDAPGPIDVRPLRSVGTGNTGDPSCARVDAADRPLKRMSQGPRSRWSILAQAAPRREGDRFLWWRLLHRGQAVILR